MSSLGGFSASMALDFSISSSWPGRTACGSSAARSLVLRSPYPVSFGTNTISISCSTSVSVFSAGVFAGGRPVWTPVRASGGGSDGVTSDPPKQSSNSNSSLLTSRTSPLRSRNNRKSPATSWSCGRPAGMFGGASEEGSSGGQWFASRSLEAARLTSRASPLSSYISSHVNSESSGSTTSRTCTTSSSRISVRCSSSPSFSAAAAASSGVLRLSSELSSLSGPWHAINIVELEFVKVEASCGPACVTAGSLPA